MSKSAQRTKRQLKKRRYLKRRRDFRLNISRAERAMLSREVVYFDVETSSVHQQVWSVRNAHVVGKNNK